MPRRPAALQAAIAPALLFLLLPRGVARVARGFLLGLERDLPGGGFLLFAQKPRRVRGFGLRLEALAIGLGGVARHACLGPAGGLRFAFGLPRLDRGIVGPGLAAKLAEDFLPRVLSRLLPLQEARFLESAH